MLFAVMVLCCDVFSQERFTSIIKDKKTGEALIGVTAVINSIKKAASSDESGRVSINDLQAGIYLFEFRYAGYLIKKDSIAVPSAETIVYMEASEEELDEVIVSTTRSSRTIDAIPTRVEVIAGEELDEKGNMKPGDIRMVLNESTGIQTQQTSATSANASIRIQGLDGRYTQILKDGFPLYSGAASGLGLLQIPPLDLKQVEVIKGSASTLYGGGAIAGLVNLISKTPTEDRQLNFHLNGTSAGGLDLSGFYGEKLGNTGLTVFASRNSNHAYDPANIDLTAIPEFERYTFNPKVFLEVGPKTKIDIGANTSFETRTGGDLHFIEGKGDNVHSYFERNKTSRVSSQFSLVHNIDSSSEVTIKNSLSYFKRLISVPGYDFEGRQYGSFTEVDYTKRRTNTEWVSGLTMWTDRFQETAHTNPLLRNYNQVTLGAFVQNNIHATNWLELETGMRTDYITDYGFAWLPRVSVLVTVSPKINSRFGGGLGYKTPTIFTEESERIQYRNVLPINSSVNKLERSYGLNWDVNYKTLLFNDQVSFSLNHMVFYTFLNNPLLMIASAGSDFKFKNIAGHIDTKGMETNLKIVFSDFKFFSGYTLTDTRIHTGNSSTVNPLTARHRLNNVLMYELEEKWKLGAEAYYYSSQRLNTGGSGKPYWIFGFMAEKLWEKFSLYINFENFSDTRQTRFGPIYSGSVSNPVFSDIYAPLDGFVINGGLKLRL